MYVTEQFASQGGEYEGTDCVLDCDVVCTD
jgi:hypothetical protein